MPDSQALEMLVTSVVDTQVLASSPTSSPKFSAPAEPGALEELLLKTVPW